MGTFAGTERFFGLKTVVMSWRVDKGDNQREIVEYILIGTLELATLIVDELDDRLELDSPESPIVQILSRIDSSGVVHLYEAPL